MDDLIEWSGLEDLTRQYEVATEQLEEIFSIAEVASTSGVSRGLMESLESLVPEVANENFPAICYSTNPSGLNLEIAQEGLIVGFFTMIGKIVAGIIKAILWILDKIIMMIGAIFGFDTHGGESGGGGFKAPNVSVDTVKYEDGKVENWTSMSEDLRKVYCLRILDELLPALQRTSTWKAESVKDPLNSNEVGSQLIVNIIGTKDRFIEDTSDEIIGSLNLAMAMYKSIEATALELVNGVDLNKIPASLKTVSKANLDFRKVKVKDTVGGSRKELYTVVTGGKVKPIEFTSAPNVLKEHWVAFQDAVSVLKTANVSIEELAKLPSSKITVSSLDDKWAAALPKTVEGLQDEVKERNDAEATLTSAFDKLTKDTDVASKVSVRKPEEKIKLQELNRDIKGATASMQFAFKPVNGIMMGYLQLLVKGIRAVLAEDKAAKTRCHTWAGNLMKSESFKSLIKDKDLILK